ncbi:MAG: hypothetical protein A2073_02635 [Deltaproteobacteria bacterium GWC2_42_11]|nr:MAG: hypothetical protein A2073_02635 [Deltaproteobacteria bacterium GWC2_42_11]HBO83832.1 4-alpha-glucanotransferase [Deltaproteobacteria bacterium]
MPNFIFCVHIHQPVGNFDFVVEDACKNAYLPFLKILSEYPSIKLSLHISGYLLDYIHEHHRSYIERLRTMVKAGQVELLGAGYYEPVLTVIPEADRTGQINLMSDKLNKYFGVRPRGIWLTERVWEPHLPESLSNADVEYVVVDDYHFVKAGLKKEDLSGYYITEEQGHILKVFPGSERLRYIIPFEHPEKFIGFLKNAKNESSLFVFADDGEKFGVWPGTHDWVYKERWLKKFLDTLTNNLDWIKPVTFSEYIEENEPVGRVYLPTTSYMEMGEWALPAEASLDYTNLVNDIKTWHDGERIRRFLQGGMWRNFMAKYPEANWMHKRMLSVSKQLKNQKSKIKKGNMATASRHLYMAQCNDAYWHGIFGGLYLPHIRSAVYENLITAENIIEGDDKRSSETRVEIADIDADTQEEILIRTHIFNIFLLPHKGGSIQELDFKPKAYNLTNVLTRRYEGYHNMVRQKASEQRDNAAKSIHDVTKVRETGLERALIYDKYERRSLIDHFIKLGTTPDVILDAIRAGEFEEGGGFVNAVYDYRVVPEINEVVLHCTSTAFGIPVRVEKGIKTEGTVIAVNYRITNLSDTLLHTVFVSEWNTLLGFGLKARDMGDMEEFELQEDWLGIKFNMGLKPQAHLYIYPVETVSVSEMGFEKNFQALCIMPCWDIRVAGGDTVSIGLTIEVLDDSTKIYLEKNLCL